MTIIDFPRTLSSTEPVILLADLRSRLPEEFVAEWDGLQEIREELKSIHSRYLELAAGTVLTPREMAEQSQLLRSSFSHLNDVVAETERRLEDQDWETLREMDRLDALAEAQML